MAGVVARTNFAPLDLVYSRALARSPSAISLFLWVRPTARYLITNHLSRGSGVTATLPTGDPLPSAMKQASGSNLGEDRRVLASFSLWNGPNALSKIPRRVPSSPGLRALIAVSTSNSDGTTEDPQIMFLLELFNSFKGLGGLLDSFDFLSKPAVEFIHECRPFLGESPACLRTHSPGDLL